jgi:hypothetical protein
MERSDIQLRKHQKNIDRYQGQLEATLSETERQYLKKLLSDETIAMLRLMNRSAEPKEDLWIKPASSSGGH